MRTYTRVFCLSWGRLSILSKFWFHYLLNKHFRSWIMSSENIRISQEKLYLLQSRENNFSKFSLSHYHYYIKKFIIFFYFVHQYSKYWTSQKRSALKSFWNNRRRQISQIFDIYALSIIKPLKYFPSQFSNFTTSRKTPTIFTPTLEEMVFE